jgi:Protein of unknown function (DUF3187)
MTIKSLVLLICIFPLTAFCATAFDFAPFRVRNLSPTVLVQTQAVAEPARLSAPGDYKVYTDLDLANHATINSSDGEQIHLDGETLVGTIGLRRGVGERLQIGFDLPWVSHDEGSLDGFISDWHDFFGLPTGDRDQLPDNELAFRYQRNSDELLNLDRSVDSVGDLRLHLAWQFAVSESTATALHGSLKVPTGDADKMSGSEAWGVSLSLAHDRRILLDHGATAAFWGGLGGSWLGDGEVLAEQAENWAANAWLGAGWSPQEWFALKLQVDTQTALYDSDLAELGDPAVILTIGGTIALGERTFLDLSVGEDLVVNASPDVTFQLGLSHSF